MAMQIKRRNSGAAGAPATLKSGQFAWNNTTKKLYLGTGDDGSGNATSIEEVAGEGSVVTLFDTDQTIYGQKTFNELPVIPQTPTLDTEAASKGYVDDQIAGGGVELGLVIHGKTAKSSSLADADEVILSDSEGAWAGARSALSVVRDFFKETFDTVYAAAGSYLTASSTDTLTNKTIDANGTGNSISNLEVADFAANVVDTDVTLAANSDTRLASQKAAKAYVDGKLANLGKRARVRAATTADITIATALNNGDVLDGVTLATGDLVLVKNQTAGEQNGVYVVGASPARFGEFDDYDDFPASLISVAEGTANADTVWLCTSNTGGTIDSTALVFAKQTMSGELLAVNNLSDINDAGSARSNLSLSSMATMLASNVTLTGGDVSGVKLDDGTY